MIEGNYFEKTTFKTGDCNRNLIKASFLVIMVTEDNEFSIGQLMPELGHRGGMPFRK